MLGLVLSCGVLVLQVHGAQMVPPEKSMVDLCTIAQNNH